MTSPQKEKAQKKKQDKTSNKNENEFCSTLKVERFASYKTPVLKLYLVVVFIYSCIYLFVCLFIYHKRTLPDGDNRKLQLKKFFCLKQSVKEVKVIQVRE